MEFDPLVPPPLATDDLPGVGGKIKVEPEDFDVEEIPAYPPSGEGEFLYLWIEKRSLSAEYFERQLADRLGVSPNDIGTAGLKDRHAVTRQMVSVPMGAKDQLDRIEGDGIRLLSVSQHTNKLKSGHLQGNGFRILIRDVVENVRELLPPLVERLRTRGMPNFYGEQRFGRDGETFRIGMDLLKPSAMSKSRRPRPFLRKLALSAAQSGLFNEYLARRLQDGFFAHVFPGDVMSHWPRGGLFVAEDVDAEQARFDAHDIVTTGPMFGRKTYPAQGEAARREAEVLAAFELNRQHFDAHGKLLQGTRRPNVVFLPDLEAEVEPEGVRMTFTLPAGSYATVLLREVTKAE